MERSLSQQCNKESGLLGVLNAVSDTDKEGHRHLDFTKLFRPSDSACEDGKSKSSHVGGMSKPGDPLEFDTQNIYPGCLHEQLTSPKVAEACYRQAQEHHEKELSSFWSSVEKAKAEGRDVKQFPPGYDGPEKPAGFEPIKPLTVKQLPTVNEMVEQSRGLNRYAAGDDSKPDFKLREVPEAEFKKAYARETLKVGESIGLAPEAVKKVVMDIYAFECGGKATHDMLSGVPMGLTRPDNDGTTINYDQRRAIHPKSSAVGYNQIIMSTNLTFADNEAPAVANRLRELAKDSPRKTEIEDKAKLYEDMQKVLHRELSTMANQNKSSQNKYLDNDGNFKYNLYADFAKSRSNTSLGITGRQLSTALHALNLDGDIGPVIQSRQLAQVVSHTLNESNIHKIEQKALGFNEQAQFYDGLDDKTKTRAVDEVFRRAHITDPAVRDGLRSKVESMPSGMSDSLSLKNLSEEERTAMRTKVLALKGQALSPAAAGLVDKLHVVGFDGRVAHEYLGAAVELGNLAGSKQADAMLDPAKANLPTVNFFDRKGYEANGIVHRKTAGKLLDAIFKVMHGANSSAGNWGNQQFEEAYEALKK